MSKSYYERHLKDNAEYKEKKRIYDAEYRAKHHKKIKERGIKYRANNKEKIKHRKSVDFRKNRERYRKSWHRNVLRWRFGITLEQYQKLLADQNGVCKICGTFKLNRQQRRMGVDHCHKSGNIRGILCDWCNQGLSRFNDNVDLLQRAINYIKTNGEDVNIGGRLDLNMFSPKTKNSKKKMNSFISNSCYSSFVNLDHRKDRLTHILSELSKAGIHADKTRGILPNEVSGDLSKYKAMLTRTPGALGCHIAQTDIMREALYRNKNAFVMEDDLVFCSDIQKRFDYIQDFLNKNEWDIFWLGGTFHIGPPWWHNGTNPDLPEELGGSIGRDAECTSDPRIMRTYGAFSTHAYIVNKNSIQKVLDLLEENVHLSMGIDWIMIKIQPQLKTYAFVPGCVKQMDNMSDIGGGMTVYSGFSRLNGTEENSRYWWQDKMEDFDPTAFDWKEAAI